MTRKFVEVNIEAIAPLHLRHLYVGVEHEKRLHREFAAFRMNGEWFKAEVLDYLEGAA